VSSDISRKNMTDAVEHHIKYITHLAFLKWIVGIALLVITFGSVIISAGIGPARIPPGVTARILLSHLPGFGYLLTAQKLEISNRADALQKKIVRLQEQIKQLEENSSTGKQIRLLKSELFDVEKELSCCRESARDLENYKIWIWEGRMPRILLALLAGGGLAISGAIFQGLVLNPLASSGTLGVSGGAAAGASLFIVFGSGTFLAGNAFGIPVAAFLGAVITLSLVWFVAKSGRGSTSPLSLILAGVIVGLFLGALMSFIRIIAEEETLRTLTLWGVGSLAGREWTHVNMGWPVVLTGVFFAIVYARDLNLLSLGAQQARHLGVNVHRSRQILMVIAALITAGAVSVTGPIGFVGLVVPHSVRMLIGPDHRILIPFSALGGAFFLLFCDTVGRTIASPLELPVGIVTSLIGAPFFVYIYKTRMKEGAVIT